MERELQFAQQDAQAEQQDAENRAAERVPDKLNPVIEQVANEKGLHMRVRASPTRASSG